ncbi:MAG: magnesium transporter [Clostridia bacterium]|nr:magnesium transporter [Clostridia bacterium]
MDENEKIQDELFDNEEENKLEEEEEEEAFERPDYEHELVEILRSDLPEAEKKERLGDYHENDIASALELLTPEERQQLYDLMDAETVSEVIAYAEDAGEYLAEMDVEQAADVLENMDADDAVDILDELDEEQKQEIFLRMDAESRRDIAMIESFDEDEIGARMTTNYIAVPRGSTIRQAMKAVVEQAADNDNLMTIYVLEKDRTFYGAITLQSLFMAREWMDLETLIITSYPFVYAAETMAECMEELKEYSEDSIPVLDKDKKLLGVITAQDLVEAVDEELGEDYARLGGLTAEEDLKEPLVQSLKKRVPWLLVLMVLSLLVSTVVGLFEPVVAKLAVVVAFQSLVLDMAGNVGTQSLAVTIRVLSDETDLTGRQKFAFMLKEARTGLTCGFLMGLISVVFCGLYINFTKDYSLGFSFAVSGCIGLAMMLAMTVSSITGTCIPMFFQKVGVDPAVASGPLITTVNDLVAVVSYYGLAFLLLIQTLHLAG